MTNKKNYDDRIFNEKKGRHYYVTNRNHHKAVELSESVKRKTGREFSVGQIVDHAMTEFLRKTEDEIIREYVQNG